MMGNNDVIWARDVVARWATEKGIPSPRVRMISRIKQGILGRYKDNTIFLYQKTWDEDDLLGKILVLAHEFGHHIQHTLGMECGDDNASVLGRELVQLELREIAKAKGVTVRGLMKMKEINNPEVW